MSTLTPPRTTRGSGATGGGAGSPGPRRELRERSGWGRAGRALLVTGLVVTAYGGGVATGVVGSGANSEQARPAASTSGDGVIDEAADRILSQAANPVSRATLERAAIDGMLKALGERWSRYFQPAEFESFSQGLEGRYSGIGAWLRVDDADHVLVASVQDSSPAAAAGLLAGDRVLAVDGSSAVDASLLDVTNELRGPAGSRVSLEVSRDGIRHELDITRGDLSTDDVTVTRLRGQIVVIRVAAFTRGVGRQVRDAVATVPDGAGVVLDLRADPGGLITEAVEVAGAFLDGGRVVSYEKRGEPTHELDALGVGQTTVPLVVLVDDGTASAAEIVAAALQDRNRAVIVGSRTYGKGSVQEPSTLSDGSALEITVGRYLTPSGRAIDGVGVEPDIAVRPSAGPTAAEGRAIEVLRGLVAASGTAGQG
jgi:carboxyl-terminal processing protease